MSRLSRSIFAAVLAFSVVVNAAAISRRRLNAPQALYFMINENKGPNSIVSIPVGRNGQLCENGLTITPTGGLGGANTDPFSTIAPNSPDALASLGAVRVVGKNLFVVNPGSNTLTMFTIDSNDPTKLTMLGAPVDTRGEFPTTVGISPKHRLACVGQNGVQSGIACSSYSTRTGLKPFDARRDFGLNNTTPPFDEYNGISTVFFSEDENILFADVKGKPRDSQRGIPITGVPELGSFGYLAAFRVNRDAVSYDVVKSSPAGAGVMFGASIIPGTKDILIADPYFGGQVITYDENTLIAATKSHTVFPMNSFTCWSGYSEVTDTAFFTDGMVNHLIETDINSGEIITVLNLTANGNFGNDDIAISGDFLYTLSPNIPTNATKVNVFDISQGRGTMNIIQSFIPGGNHSYAQGLATWGT